MEEGVGGGGREGCVEGSGINPMILMLMANRHVYSNLPDFECLLSTTQPLTGECISGALEWKQLMKVAMEIGFSPPVLVEASPLTINNKALEEKIGKWEGEQWYSGRSNGTVGGAMGWWEEQWDGGRSNGTVGGAMGWWEEQWDGGGAMGWWEEQWDGGRSNGMVGGAMGWWEEQWDGGRGNGMVGGAMGWWGSNGMVGGAMGWWEEQWDGGRSNGTVGGAMGQWQ